MTPTSRVEFNQERGWMGKKSHGVPGYLDSGENGWGTVRDADFQRVEKRFMSELVAVLQKAFAEYQSGAVDFWGDFLQSCWAVIDRVHGLTSMLKWIFE